MIGAMASKKASSSSPVRSLIAFASLSDVRGPVAMMTLSQSCGGIVSTSPRSIVMSGCSFNALVTPAEKISRSTASAPPAGTAAFAPSRIMSELSLRISSCSKPTALCSWSSERKEFEQTSSAQPSVLCAGVSLIGRISCKMTGTPILAICHAASLPARPAPITCIGLTSLMGEGFISLGLFSQEYMGFKRVLGFFCARIFSKLISMVRRKSKDNAKRFHIHLVSDATGTTLLGLSRACLAQFEDIEPVQKFWPLVRTNRQLERVISKIEQNPGPVIYTLVDKKMRRRLQDICDDLHVPCIAVLDPIIRGLSSHLGVSAVNVPGLQHAMDDDYFKRVSAIDFAMKHDDGKDLSEISKAEIVLVGVSRTSKTPTSVFLARRGLMVANIPLVPHVDVPEEKFEYKRPLYVGLTTAPERLMHIRRSRLKADKNDARYDENEYLDIDKIEEEVRKARRLFSKHKWPVIDVTKRSVEETAAEILTLYQSYQDKKRAEHER